MAGLLRNDPSQSIPASNHAHEKLEQFKTTAQNFAELAATGNGMEGATATAMTNAGSNVLGATQRFNSVNVPRVEAVRRGAEATTRTAEEGAGSLNGVDVNFA